MLHLENIQTTQDLRDYFKQQDFLVNQLSKLNEDELEDILNEIKEQLEETPYEVSFEVLNGSGIFVVSRSEINEARDKAYKQVETNITKWFENNKEKALSEDFEVEDFVYENNSIYYYSTNLIKFKDEDIQDLFDEDESWENEWQNNQADDAMEILHELIDKASEAA